MAEPPDHLIVAFLGDIVAGQEQDEIVRNIEAGDVKPHTAGG